MREKTPKLPCPCCDLKRGHQAKRALLALEAECRRQGVDAWWSGGKKGWSIDAAEAKVLQWACPTCLRRQHALPAQPWQQTWCDDYPYFAFFDVRLSCSDCGCDFVFSASEQQFWYEKLKFWVQSRPKQCASCRKARRNYKQAQSKLQDRLQTYDKDSPIDLAQIANLYIEMGADERGAEFFRRAVNAAKRTEKEAELEAFLAEQNPQI